MAEDTRTATPAGANAAQGALPRRGVFWRFAARSLKLNRSRTIVSIIGIALSCALITAITAIFTSVATLYEGLLKAEIVTEGAWQVELVNVPEDEIDIVHADSRVTRSGHALRGPAQSRDRDRGRMASRTRERTRG